MSTPVAPLASAVYEGLVRHRRHLPHPHAFSYRIAQLYLDLDELEQVFCGHCLWSLERPNLAQFRRRDYLGPLDLPLPEAVRSCVERATGRRPTGPIRLLAHLRYAGHVFNPVSFYYCFDAGEVLDCIVAEITNTPWHERHTYVLPVRDSGPELQFDFAKRFHVSPFLPMQCDYRWRFTPPAQQLRVAMQVRRDGARVFDATLALERRALDRQALRRVLLRFPLMSAQVVSAIYWQALRLWLKRTPFHTHPDIAVRAR